MWRRSIEKALLQRRRGSSALRENLLFSRHNQVGEAAEAGTAEALWQGKLPKASTTAINPRVIFPWRHDTKQLPRLIPGSDDFELQGSYFGPGVPYLPKEMHSIVTHFTGNQMQIPWYQLPFPGWKQELADSSSWAFTQAVAGVMSNLYRVPFDDIRQDGEFDVDLKHIIKKDELHNEEEVFPELDYMIEENLRTLYQSAHECGRGQLQVHLQMRPTSAKLVSAFVVPYLTREEVKLNPSKRNTYRNMYTRLVDEERDLGREISLFETGKFVAEEIRELARNEVELYDDYASLESTVVVQVLVHCDEVFSVTDVASGAILQGHGDGKIRNVPHLVRLEAVLETKQSFEGRGRPETEVGPWQITDWDDLLEGNIWFL